MLNNTWEAKKPSSIEFKRLNGLTPTVESCTMKLLEEVGELMQLIGKGQRLSGEINNYDMQKLSYVMLMESLDVAQSATTMVFTLADEYGYILENRIQDHEQKLREKGYLK